MHPAYSVIIFTTFSGAGFGLMAVLGFEAAFGEIARHWLIGLLGLGLAAALAGAGLLSSTFHLGHPERAWRAFTQWRSSWLSREGVLAVATFIPAAILGLTWIVTARPGVIITLTGIVTALLALATVYTTGMIYQSLPTIRAWHRTIVAPIYILLALMSGVVIAHALLLTLAQGDRAMGTAAIMLLVASAIAKLTYWHQIDNAAPLATPGTATGLGQFGTIRTLEHPHTMANYVMREMGYSIGRKHAAKLRQIAVIAAFALPALLIALSLTGNGLAALAASWGAVITMMAGLFVERWLFFAEAEHVVMNYYGAKSA